MMKTLKNVFAWLAAHGSKRMLLMILATTVALSSAAGGTLAWLIDQTPEVTNTFTYGDINITLTETDNLLDGDNDPTTNEYRMTPGASIEKDPVVTVQADSEDCWLFVKLEKSEHFDSFLSYEMAAGWTALAGQEDVFYRTVDRANTEQAFPVLRDNQISVLTSVTKAMLNDLDANGASNYPKLTLTAYAVQRDLSIDGIDEASAAWSLIQSESVSE